MSIEICQFIPPDVTLGDGRGEANWGNLDDDERRFLQIFDRVNGRRYDKDDKMPDSRANSILHEVKDQECYVACEGAEIAGVGVCHARRTKDELWISALAVLGSFQRLGIGSELMKHLEDVARRKELSTVALRSTLGAEIFYEGRGYCSKEPSFDGGLRCYTKRVS